MEKLKISQMKLQNGPKNVKYLVVLCKNVLALLSGIENFVFSPSLEQNLAPRSLATFYLFNSVGGVQ